ncbi:MAG: RusA family crossover junction endodeoxyribonuclease [Thermodesulfobacteriota bacterium]
MTFQTWARSRILRRRLRIPELPKRKNALEGIDPRLKQRAFDKLVILREYQIRLLNRGFKNRTEIQRKFLEDFNAGILRPEGFSIRHVSRSSLLNWLKCYENGKIAALVDRYTGHKKDASSGRARYKPLSNPVEMKFPGPPKGRGKADFVKRVGRRWRYLPVECPISLAIFYQMPIPKKTRMPRRMKMLKHKIAHTGRPNMDDLNAFIVDCMAGIVFRNHSQIVELYSKKEYAWWGQTRVFVRPLKG